MTVRFLVVALTVLLAGCAAPAVPPTTANTPASAQPPSATSPNQTPSESVAPMTPEPKVVGYFTSWGVYDRNYKVSDLEASGAAAELTHLLYAFGNVVAGECAIGDEWAEYQMPFSAKDSVSGVADLAGQPLAGNFNQLLALKKIHPQLKILWSFGGWTWSAGFTQVVRSEESIARFAASCHRLVDDPRWAGLFDGIDIDWEYPNACGLKCDTSGPDAYPQLLRGLRSEFGDQALITSAITADGQPGGNLEAADYAAGVEYLDFVMPMTYDYFGAWDHKGPTAPHSPLTSWDTQPLKGADATTTITVLKMLGVPSQKILLGLGFYGRGWQGVKQAAAGARASGPAPAPGEPGADEYRNLIKRCPATGEIAGTAFGFCDGQWWSYDTPETITAKMAFAKQEGLGGAFFWELGGDTDDAALTKAVAAGLK